MRRYAIARRHRGRRRPGCRRGPRERGHRPAPDGHHRHHGRASGGAHRGVGAGRVHRGASRSFHGAGRPPERGHDGYANGFSADPGSPVRAVDVETARGEDGLPVARVRVSLTEPVSHNVRSQRNMIFVELDRGAGDGRRASDCRQPRCRAGAAPAHTPSAADGRDGHSGCAALISSVRTTREEGTLSVILEGNGRLAARNVELAGGQASVSGFRWCPSGRARGYARSARRRSSACASRSTATSRS